MSKGKKIAIVAIVIAIFIVGAVLISDSMVPTFSGEGIINRDTNSFTLVEVENSNRSISIYGKHSIFSLPKFAHGQYTNESSYLSDFDRSPWITSNVSLKCKLNAALLSSAIIRLSFLLSDNEGDELDIVHVYQRAAVGNTTTIDEEFNISGTIGYSLQVGERYLISIRMTITLSGESSAEGPTTGFPCILTVDGIDVH